MTNKPGRKPIPDAQKLKMRKVYLNDADWLEAREAGASDVMRIGLALVRRRKSRGERKKVAV